jgi:hemerythrin superfamily protein
VADDQPEPIHYPVKLQHTQNEEAQLYQENKKIFQNMSAILLSDIEKVRTDPGYVNQAKQISNSINTVINLTKLQLQLIKSK